MNMLNSQDQSIKLTPWPALHFVLLSVMVGAIAIGLKDYLSLWVATPVAIAIVLLFSKLSHVVSAKWRDVNLARRAAAATLLVIVFGLTGSLSYATIYRLMFAQSNGAQYLDELIAESRVRLERVRVSVNVFNDEVTRWSSHSAGTAEIENSRGSTCGPSEKGWGPIKTFRDNEEAVAKQLKERVSTSVAPLLTKLNAVDAKPANGDYSLSVKSMLTINEAIREFNAWRASSLLQSTKQQLESTRNVVLGDGKKCNDDTRMGAINAAIAAIVDVEKIPEIKEVRPGIDLQNKNSLVGVSILRGVTLVANLPPVSWILSAFGTRVDFSSDPLMTRRLRELGALNFETLPFVISMVLELCILLTARWAYEGGGTIALIRPESLKALQEKDGWAGFLARAFAAPFVRIDERSSIAQDADAEYFTGPPEFKHSPQDPVFEDREIAFARSLGQCLVELEWGSYILIPNHIDFASQHYIASALAYEGLASVLALNVAWNEISTLHHTLEHQWPELRMKVELPQQRYHLYKLRSPFAQALRLSEIDRVLHEKSSAA